MLALQEARTRISSYAHEHVLLMESLVATGVLAVGLLAGHILNKADFVARPEITCQGLADQSQQQAFLSDLRTMESLGLTPEERTTSVKESCATQWEFNKHMSPPLDQR